MGQWSTISVRIYITDKSQVVGQILSTVIIRGVLHMEAPWSYRIPFAIQ